VLHVHSLLQLALLLQRDLFDRTFPFSLLFSTIRRDSIIISPCPILYVIRRIDLMRTGRNENLARLTYFERDINGSMRVNIHVNKHGERCVRARVDARVERNAQTENGQIRCSGCSSRALVIFPTAFPQFRNVETLAGEPLPAKVARLHYGNNSPCVTLRHSHRGGAPALKYAAARLRLIDNSEFKIPFPNIYREYNGVACLQKPLHRSRRSRNKCDACV